MTADPTAATPTPPARKPRPRWPTRLLAAAGLLVLAAVAAWLVWLLVAMRQRDAALDRLRAAGVVVTSAELAAQVASVPPAQNPAVDYAAAFLLIDPAADAWHDWDLYPKHEYEQTPDERAEYAALRRKAVAAGADVLARLAGADTKIRPAVAVTAGDFGVWSERDGPLPANLIDAALPHLFAQRTLADLLHADARVAAEDAKDAEDADAERVLRDAVRLIGSADALDADAHTLVEHLVAVGTRRLAAASILETADIAADGPTPLLETVTTLLLDDAASAAGYRRGLAGEATIQQAAIVSLAAAPAASGRQPAPTGGIGWRAALLQPVLRGAQTRLADHMLPALNTADAATLPAAAATLPDTAWMDRASHLDRAASLLIPSLDRAMLAEFKARADLRLAAAALAVRRHARDHDGAPPPTLDALVPRYLPRVPADPMAAAGELRYDAARGLLWSVGEDSRDDGGDATPRPDVRRVRDARWDARDAAVPLRGVGGGV